MILSVDGGATKTCAIIYDEKSHKFMASGISAASNFMSVSEQVSLENIQIAMPITIVVYPFAFTGTLSEDMSLLWYSPCFQIYR